MSSTGIYISGHDGPRLYKALHLRLCLPLRLEGRPVCRRLPELWWRLLRVRIPRDLLVLLLMLVLLLRLVLLLGLMLLLGLGLVLLLGLALLGLVLLRLVLRLVLLRLLLLLLGLMLQRGRARLRRIRTARGVLWRRIGITTSLRKGRGVLDRLGWRSSIAGHLIQRRGRVRLRGIGGIRSLQKSFITRR